ncbi:hypothetical protein, partial [Rhodoblastus sp.]|uniref:hypothetical protein n=1 Tax=Rhodoblastus sp. TaxID=1962975 RepID=UPI003F9C2A88
APVSHGVEPHDFETGQPRRLRNCTITNLAASRRPYRESGLVLRPKCVLEFPSQRRQYAVSGRFAIGTTKAFKWLFPATQAGKAETLRK